MSHLGVKGHHKVGGAQKVLPFFSLEYLNGAVARGSCNAPVGLAEGACLDLPSLMAVRHLRFVGHCLSLNTTHVPQLGAPVTREGHKQGRVWDHSYPGHVTRRIFSGCGFMGVAGTYLLIASLWSWM